MTREPAVRIERSSTDDAPVLAGALRGYLRIIYELTESGETARQARIAEALEISPAAVSVSTGRLIDRGFVQGRGSLELTARGARVARRLVRKHRLAQCLFVDLIGMDTESARIEADRWAFVITDRAERALYRRLRWPTTDPTGAAIPGREELDDPAAPGSSDA